MNKLLIFILTAAIIPGLCTCTEKKVNGLSENQLTEMRTTAADFMKELKSILVKEIQTGGVLKAVAVCADTAQILTGNFGLQRGVFVKRVSFRNRNKNNYPDEYEQRILNKFQLMHQNNELNENTESIDIAEEGEFQYLRYMKPIIVQAECLNCHGNENEIMPEVREIIKKKYPDDKARNYKIGDLRGAVSVKKLVE